MKRKKTDEVAGLHREILNVTDHAKRYMDRAIKAEEALVQANSDLLALVKNAEMHKALHKNAVKYKNHWRARAGYWRLRCWELMLEGDRESDVEQPEA